VWAAGGETQRPEKLCHGKTFPRTFFRSYKELTSQRVQSPSYSQELIPPV